MKNISEYIDSGVIENYVLGMADSNESAKLEEMCLLHPEVKEALVQFEIALEQKALAAAIEPDPIIKPLLMATLNYIDRLEKGEPLSFPPMLSEKSKISDYAVWLERDDMVISKSFKDVYARLIAHTPEVTTAIVWIENMAPAEVHDNEYEKFLIVEGSCNIVIENETHSLVPGSYLSIPLHKNHKVVVTSRIPCKVILQRVAA